MSFSVDINSDIGEALSGGYDQDILQLVSSVNISCGVHAGSDELTKSTMGLAQEAGVSIGAHPGMPGEYGRSESPILVDDAIFEISRQLTAFRVLAVEFGVNIAHVKPHGALYNQAETDADFASAIVDTIARTAPGAAVFGLAGGNLIGAANARGLRSVGEFFADRAYTSEAKLLSRSIQGAVIAGTDAVAARAISAFQTGRVLTCDGAILPVKFESICVHGDTPSAVAIIEEIRLQLDRIGVQIARPRW
jgi:UPF0271 protein